MQASNFFPVKTLYKIVIRFIYCYNFSSADQIRLKLQQTIFFPLYTIYTIDIMKVSLRKMQSSMDFAQQVAYASPEQSET